MNRQVIASPGAIQDYFLEAVRAALEHLRFQPNQQTTTYLVELLCEFARAAVAVSEQPLGMVMAEAQRADPASSIGSLKRVGDQSLYLAGYFTASLLRSKLDPGYYVVLGSGAYRQLSRVLRRHRSQAGLVLVYRELGEDFHRFAEVLSEVRGLSEASRGERERELGELYHEWLRTGDAGARRRLQAAGILILRRPGQRQ